MTDIFRQVVANETTVEKADGCTRVVLYKTTVVTFDEAEIILNTGGWWTWTTKNRMNRSSRAFDLGYRVYQKGKKWYVEYKQGEHEYETEKIRLDRKTGKVTPVR